MNEEEIAKKWQSMVKGEKDAHRRMLHGSMKSITQENKFKLLKIMGKEIVRKPKNQYSRKREG